MTIQQAIEKAIEGGWNWKKDFDYPDNLRVVPDDISALATAMREKVLLSPAFWQALGKGMGWENVMDWFPIWGYCDRCGEELLGTMKPWFYHWHRFINYLAENKSIEEFFATLK